MGVAVDHQLDAGGLCRACMKVAKVQPLEVGVDLQRRAGPRRQGDDLLHVDLVGFAPVDKPSGRVPD